MLKKRKLSNFFMGALSGMKYPPTTAFIVSHKFGYVVCSFLLNSKKSLIFLFLPRFPFISIFIQNSADTESDFDIIFLIQVGK